MENQISNSTLKLADSQMSNGNIFFDTNSILLFLIFVGLILVAFSIFKYVEFKRDEENIPDSKVVNNLVKDVSYITSDLKRFENRLKAVEKKNDGIEKVQKSILELKGIIQGGKKIE